MVENAILSEAQNLYSQRSFAALRMTIFSSFPSFPSLVTATISAALFKAYHDRALLPGSQIGRASEGRPHLVLPRVLRDGQHCGW